MLNYSYTFIHKMEDDEDIKKYKLEVLKNRRKASNNAYYMRKKHNEGSCQKTSNNSI